MKIRIVLVLTILLGIWLGTNTYSSMCAEKTWADFRQDFTWLSLLSTPDPTSSEQTVLRIGPSESTVSAGEAVVFAEIILLTQSISTAAVSIDDELEDLDGFASTALKMEKSKNLRYKLENLRRKIDIYVAEYELYDDEENVRFGVSLAPAGVIANCCEPGSRGLLKMIGLARSFLRDSDSGPLQHLEDEISTKVVNFLEAAVALTDQVDFMLMDLDNSVSNLASNLASNSTSELSASVSSEALVKSVTALTGNGRELLSTVFNASEFAHASLLTKKYWFMSLMGLYCIGIVMVTIWYLRSLVAITVATRMFKEHGEASKKLLVSPFPSINTLGEEVSALVGTRRREFDRISTQKQRESEIAGVVAHEYGNNIMVIEGLLTIASSVHRDGQHEDVTNYLEKAIEACTTAKSIVAPLRESGESQGKKNSKVISLKRSLETEIIRLTGESDQEITLELDHRFDGIRVDEDDFLSIIRNLIMNAQNSNSKVAGSKLAVVTHPLDKMDSEIVMGLHEQTEAGVEFICIEVRDEGEGIPEAIGNQVFDLGYSTKSEIERKEQPGARGCGLHIVWNKVKDNGGVIDFVRNASGGVTFRVFLPRALANEIELPVYETAEGFNPKSSGEVLLVEDNVQVRELIELMLTRENYHSTSVSSAEVALTEINARGEENQFRLIISDINLGSDCMSGIDFSRMLRSFGNNIPILLITAYAKLEILSGVSLEDGNLQVLEKPFTPIELYRNLDRLIGRPGGEDGNEGEADFERDQVIPV